MSKLYSMDKPVKKLIIAIDGYSSSGKSTVAKAIAKKLRYIYVDSGAMYRAVTLFALQNNLIKKDFKIDEENLLKLIPEIKITFNYNEKLARQETYLNDINVEEEIRKMEVSNAVSYISKIKFVRAEMVKLQQKFGKNKGIVMDGRDIGTVVFPYADIKIFMNADAMARAKRRYKELTEKGEQVELDEIIKNVKQRDHLDETRSESPLKKAKDAILLDNSNMNQEQQLDWVMNLIDNNE